MFYLDPQKTTLRRDSSLIRPSTKDEDADAITVFRGVRPCKAEYSPPALQRTKGAVENELVTMMFESMLGNIVESWAPIETKPEDNYECNLDFGRTGSDFFVASLKKKKADQKSIKTAKSRSKEEEEEPPKVTQVSWWSGPDEKVVIHFRNGNKYEGNVSMKAMHGEGRFQWANGTVYLGQFYDNEITGQGTMFWKDDTWYQGQFAGNLRHGEGLYVDSRLQRSYAGGWHYGTKHGQGVIYYDGSFTNSYDGHWIKNERFGYGVREYSRSSGYMGDWDRNIREGNGLMIWPNTDCYRGEWLNGVMSGYGIYIWDAYYNNSMSLPSLKAYHGKWEKGSRNGFGLLDFGLGLGSFYKGEFKNNNKNGIGHLVTNNGLIIEDKNLFVDDNIAPYSKGKGISTRNLLKSSMSMKMRYNLEPCTFDICDSTVNLRKHIELALKNIDRREEIIASIIVDYFENNKPPRVTTQIKQSCTFKHDKKIAITEEKTCLEDFFSFEEISLRNAIKCYEFHLRNIYYYYATICNTEEISFKPVLIRLYLWQLYYDCKIHEKGLTLCDIDLAFYKNREWLARKPHDPFEKIYFWQFLHGLLLLAVTLFAKKKMPGPKPDTIVASVFRTFMESVLLPNCVHPSSRLISVYGVHVPLKATYELYESFGEPHTIRTFIKAVRHPPNALIRALPVIDAPEKCVPWGCNVYIFEDEMIFPIDREIEELPKTIKRDPIQRKLHNLANLSTKTIIETFAKVFPQVIKDDLTMDLEVKITFFEFFEVFIRCVEEGIKVKEEELKWRNKLASLIPTIAPNSTPIF